MFHIIFPGANLSDANLRYADLRDADLRDADLRCANLRYANLRDADLRDADLRYADLRYADLRYANLRDADLRYAKLPSFQIPQEGALTVYKACIEGVVKLQVPARAKRTASMVSRKCRAEYVKVLATPDGAPATGLHNRRVVYKVGKTVKPDCYDPDPRIECTHGIHFFLTREEAQAFHDA